MSYNRVKSQKDVNLRVVKCIGEAHSNPYIDHCMICMPYWENYVVCIQCGYKVVPTSFGYSCRHCKIIYMGKIGE